MITREVILSSVLLHDPEPIIEEMMRTIDNSGKCSSIWTFDVTHETMAAINRCLDCKTLACQLQSYLNDKLIETLQNINSVTGLTIDRVAI